MGDWVKGDFIKAGMAPGGGKAGCALVPGGQGYVMGGDVFVFPRSDDATKPTAAQALLAKTMLDPVTQVEFSQKKVSSALGPFAKKGIALMRDPLQIPSINVFASADMVGDPRCGDGLFQHDGRRRPVLRRRLTFGT